MMDLGIEQVRLESIVERLGLQAAILFVKQTLIIYRKGVLNKKRKGKDTFHHASLREYGYRKSFIESYLIFKRFISAYENKNV
jgi:hypothetical protein